MTKQKLKYMINNNNHILIPQNNVSMKAQELAFSFLEKIQYEYIHSYNVLTEAKKYEISNEIGNFFVHCFLNKDGASFRLMVGYKHKGLMTQEELKNIIRDYDIAMRMKKTKKFKTFLLLDLLIVSNRRADAIIINNDYEINLYDFSEGIIAEKIKNFNSVEECETEKEKKQYIRKKKQEQRINSYKNKLKIDSRKIKNIIIDNDSVSIEFCNYPCKFYDFNNCYKFFLEQNCEKIYIPNSLCFIMKKEDISNSFYALPLRCNIDSPFFITEERPIIQSEYINHIYQNNTFIGISLIYLTLFVESFTYFKIRYTKNAYQDNSKNHFYILKNGKKRYMYFEDTRTKNWVPISYGFLEKHLFMNMDLESLIIYISWNCNKECTEDIITSIIKYDELNKSNFDFFILK